MDLFFGELEENGKAENWQFPNCSQNMNPSPWQFNACTIVINAGLIILNDDLQCVYIDESLARVSGKAATEHLGKPVGDILPDQTQALEHIMQEVLNSGKPFLGYELTSNDSHALANSHRWLVSCYPLIGQKGKTLGIDCVVLES
ncbi:MAG: PAS domain-containing protein [Scytolyngbya sp. HA4215-MV1]|nr:PAS domain-containing protein [Scytolyngbya sp. HA4215-MV1]